MSIKTVFELEQYLENTTIDNTIIYLSYTNTPDKPFIETLTRNRYATLRLRDKNYSLTYEYLYISSPEINQFFLEKLTNKIPYLISYKKRALGQLDQWWRPCKQVDPNGTFVELRNFITGSLT
jgi:hypothetical protein